MTVGTTRSRRSRLGVTETSNSSSVTLETKATAATQGLTLVIDNVAYFLGDAANRKIKNKKSNWTWSDSDHDLSWTDGDTVTVKLVAHNVVATGQPTISGGAQVGKTLTASDDGIEDLNALPDPPGFTYQWVRVDGSNSETNIAGATSSTYTLTAPDVGHTIKVNVSFTDFRGNAEGPLTSAAYPAHGTVVAAAPPCRHHFGNDWCATMTVADAEGDGLRLGYEKDDKFGSLTDNQIPYDGQTFTVWTVYTDTARAFDLFYFGSDDGSGSPTSRCRAAPWSLLTSASSQRTRSRKAGVVDGDKWEFDKGELPADLAWTVGQDVTVSVRFPISGPPSSTANASSSPGVCPEATTVDIAYGGAEGPPASLITSATVSDDTLTVHVQAHLQYPAEVLEGYKMRFRELKPNREPWAGLVFYLDHQ